jgi:hypothetical protein
MVRLLPAEVVRDVPIPVLLRVLPRCSLCPLFDAERAIREGANPPPALVLEIRLRPHRTPPGREPSPDLDPGWQVPDFPPQAWGEPAAEEPPD